MTTTPPDDLPLPPMPEDDEAPRDREDPPPDPDVGEERVRIGEAYAAVAAALGMMTVVDQWFPAAGSLGDEWSEMLDDAEREAPSARSSGQSTVDAFRALVLLKATRAWTKFWGLRNEMLAEGDTREALNIGDAEAAFTLFMEKMGLIVDADIDRDKLRSRPTGDVHMAGGRSGYDEFIMLRPTLYLMKEDEALGRQLLVPGIAGTYEGWKLKGRPGADDGFGRPIPSEDVDVIAGDTRKNIDGLGVDRGEEHDRAEGDGREEGDDDDRVEGDDDDHESGESHPPARPPRFGPGPAYGYPPSHRMPPHVDDRSGEPPESSDAPAPIVPRRAEPGFLRRNIRDVVAGTVVTIATLTGAGIWYANRDKPKEQEAGKVAPGPQTPKNTLTGPQAAPEGPKLMLDLGNGVTAELYGNATQCEVQLKVPKDVAGDLYYVLDPDKPALTGRHVAAFNENTLRVQLPPEAFNGKRATLRATVVKSAPNKPVEVVPGPATSFDLP